MIAVTVRSTSPYKGLSHYGERDAPFFFGREAETEVIAANLLASRLTLLYGASGVGKSSLLRAGVARHLRERAAENAAVGGSAEFLVVTFPPDETTGDDATGRASWRDDAVAGIAAEIERAAALLGIEVDGVDRPTGFVELVDTWSERLDADILLVLDQFEEFFLYHGDERGDDAFVNELPRALMHPDLRANVLISIREDAYARLDRFKGKVPFLYDNYLRVDHLDLERARQAIVKPIDAYNAAASNGKDPVSIEPALVEEVLKHVQTGRLALGQAGIGLPRMDDGDGPQIARVETPFLQLVMERLWEEEAAAGSKVLRRVTLDRLKGAERIVRTHLDEAMDALSDDDREVAARAFRQLVTPSGTKIAHLPSDLAALEGDDVEDVTRVLDALAAARVLRPVAPPPGETHESRYEIFHDVLGPAVLDWRARYEQAQEHELEQQRLAQELELRERERAEAEQRAAEQRRNARRFRLVAAGAGLLAVVASLAFGFAYLSFLRAHDLALRAHNSAELAREISDVTHANLSLATNPADALRTAIHAADRGHSPNSILVLRRAARASNLVAALRTPSTLPGATFSPDGAWLITAYDRGAATWNTKTGELVPVHRGDREETTQFVHDRRGDVATGYSSGSTLLWRAHGGQQHIGLGYPIALAPNGAFLAVVHGTVARVVRTNDPLTPLDTVRPIAGRTIAALSQDGTLLFESIDGVPALRLKGRNVTLWTPPAPPLSFDQLRFTPVLVAATFSDDGRAVAAAWDNGTVRVYNARNAQRLQAKRERHTPTAISFAPDGRLAVGSSNGSVSLWNWHKDISTEVRGGHDDSVSAIDFTSDGTLMATASADTTARIWNARTGALLSVLAGHADGLTSIAFSPKGDRVATTSLDGTARLWRTQADAPQLTLPRHRAAVGHVVFSGDGRSVLTTSADRSAILASATDGKTTHIFGKPIRLTAAARTRASMFNSGPNSDLLMYEPRGAVSPDSARVIVGDHIAGGAALFDARSGQRVKQVVPRGDLPSPNLALFGVGPDGRWATVAVTPNESYLFDGRTGEKHGVLRDGGRTFAGRSVPFAGGATADGRFLLAARWDGNHVSRIRLWDVVHRKPARTWVLDAASVVRNASTDRRGRYVAASNWAGNVWIWRVSDGKTLHRLDVHAGVRAQAFSPDGSLLAIAGDATSAGVWDVRTGRKIASLRGHTAPINSVQFSPDGRLLTTASDDGTARIWEAQTGDEWIEFRQGRPGRALYASFDPSGRRVAVGASDGSSAIYVCRVCGTASELLAYARTRLPVTPPASERLAYARTRLPVTP